MKIALTGASGFIGKRFIEYNKDTFEVLPVSLRDEKPQHLALAGMDAIVHLAGKAHDMQPVRDEVYYDVNYTLTKQLAERAREQGVPHFIYISSTKVYGDETHEVLDERSKCDPKDAYGKSKLQAEELLKYMSTAVFKTAVIRPPLVYGPGVKGNMLRLLDLANKNYVLPLGKTRNARSMVYIDNLIGLINSIILKQATGIFIAGDAAPVATNELIALIRKNLGKKEGLVSVPSIFRSMLKAIRPGVHTRLFGSFIVDNAPTNQQLQFHPPFSTEYGIGEMVKWYKETHS